MKHLTGGRLPHESVDAAIARIAAGQYSVFSRDQAVACGATPRVIENRLQRGLWISVHPGVYRLAGVKPLWQQSAVAAVLAGGYSAAISCNTAATLLRLPDFSPLPINIVVERGRRKRLRGVRVHEATDLADDDITVIHGIRTTNATRTLIDFAGSTPSLKLEIATDDALRRGLTSIRRLRRRLDVLGGSGRPGTAFLRSILDERTVTGIPQSPLETRVLVALRNAGIDPPICQYRVNGDNFVAVLDFAWPDRMVAVEADGYAIHAGRQSFEHDRRRARALVGLGWKLVSVTSQDLVESSVPVMEDIRTLLSR